MRNLNKSLVTLSRLMIGTSRAGRIFRIVFIAMLCFSYVSIVTIIGILYGTYYSITSIDLSHGYTLKLWTESPGLLGHWDPEIPYPRIYYQIARDGTAIVPKSYLELDFHYTYDIKVAFAEQGQLACVYDTKLWTRGLFIMWDTASGESWPRLRDDEVSYDPSVEQKWLDRYNRLKLENPTLPPFGTLFTFEH